MPKMSRQAICAKEIRKVLMAEFPGYKFSVKSEMLTYSPSVTIAWDVGPTEREVYEATKQFVIGRYDGMYDSYIRDNVLPGIPQVEYLTLDGCDVRGLHSMNAYVDRR